MSQPATDRNLLFAILAVQMDFVPRDAMFSAMVAWTETKATPLAQLLVDRGELSPARRSALDILIDEHIKAHAGDPARSLEALSSTDGVAELLTQIPDAQLQASLGHVRDHVRSQPGSESPGDLATRVPSRMEPLAPWTGRFRVVRPHAKGGLGVVSVAMDEELDREVAFKEIKPSHAEHPVSQARFVIEAEITGKLEHPGIVPVYGLGHDPMGHPYYAMRFIRGESLKDTIHHFHDPEGPYRDPSKRALQLRELLGRFLDVCDALSYAHSRGVLHRDLKPGNVMLGPFGETLVVDWGLALPLEEVPDGTESALPPLKTSKADSGSLPSEKGAVIGTPQYMPPEQAEGALDQLGPRSDVYGLGAILYDLLTGHRPVTGETQEDILKAVREGQIRPPRQVRPDIPPALEAICLKALSLRPDGRYATPRTFATDIKSYLADEPVTAYREPVIDRARRWARRHRVLVTGVAASLVVGLVGLAAVAIVQTKARNDLLVANQSLDQERLRAEDREKLAIVAVEKFRDAVVNEPLLKNTPDLEALRKRLLQEPLDFFKALRERLQANSDTRPESLGRLADAVYDLGSLMNEIGDRENALAVYREAKKIYHELTLRNPTTLTNQSGLARCYGTIGNLLLGAGQPVEAMDSFKHSLDIQKYVISCDPLNAKCQSELAATCNNLAGLHNSAGRYTDAIRIYSHAKEILTSLVIKYPDKPEYKVGLAFSFNNMAVSLGAIERFDESLNAYEQARDILKVLATRYSKNQMYRSSLASTYNNIGSFQRAIGRLAEAVDSYRIACALRAELLKESPTVTDFQSDLALSYYNLGIVQSDMGETDESLKSNLESMNIRSSLVASNPTVVAFRSDLANSHNNIGVLQRARGRLVEALDSHLEARKIRTSLAENNPGNPVHFSDLALSHLNIGNVFKGLGQIDNAMEAYQKAELIYQKLVSNYPASPSCYSEWADVVHNIASVNLESGRFDQARQLLWKAIALQKMALQSMPAHPVYRSSMRVHVEGLLYVCKKLGDGGGVAEADRELKALADSDPAIKALDARLAAILKGGQKPRDMDEGLQLAQRAYDRSLHASAARLWDEVLKSVPKLAENRQAQIPYNAACAAALAGTGRGKDEPAPTEKEQAGFRTQALAWLKGELKAWETHMGSGQAEAKKTVVESLQHWKQDSDLAGVREAKELAKWPEAERKEWIQLWGEVEALLKKAEGK